MSELFAFCSKQQGEISVQPQVLIMHTFSDSSTIPDIVLCLYLIEKNVVGRKPQTINDTTQWFAGKQQNYLLICNIKVVHLHCLSVLILHFVHPSLLYPTVNEWLVAGLASPLFHLGLYS